MPKGNPSNTKQKWIKEAVMKFFKCEKCGKIAVIFRESQCPTKCCGEAGSLTLE